VPVFIDRCAPQEIRTSEQIRSRLAGVT